MAILGIPKPFWGSSKTTGSNYTMYPLDGSDPIEIALCDNGDGGLSIEVGDYEGSMNQVSEADFMEVFN